MDSSSRSSLNSTARRSKGVHVEAMPSPGIGVSDRATATAFARGVVEAGAMLRRSRKGSYMEARIRLKAAGSGKLLRLRIEVWRLVVAFAGFSRCELEWRKFKGSGWVELEVLEDRRRLLAPAAARELCRHVQTAHVSLAPIHHQRTSPGRRDDTLRRHAAAPPGERLTATPLPHYKT